MSRGRDVWRIGNDEVEGSAQRRRHVAGDKLRACQSKAPRIVARNAKRGARLRRCLRRTRSAIRQAAPAGSRREPVPRSAMRSVRERAPRGIDCGERSLDDRFGLRPRHQRRRVDAQRQTPEFLPCRRCGQPARARSRRCAARRWRFLRRRQACAHRRRKRGMIEAERVTDQDAGIELGRIDAAGAKFLRPGAPRFGNGKRGPAPRRRDDRNCRAIGAQLHHAASSAASSAA